MFSQILKALAANFYSMNYDIIHRSKRYIFSSLIFTIVIEGGCKGTLVGGRGGGCADKKCWVNLDTYVSSPH